MLQMYKTIIIFMTLEVGGRGAIGCRIIRDIWDRRHFFMVVGGRGAAGVIIIRNA